MNLLTWISRKRFPYEPLIRVEISKNRLIHNLHEFKKLAPKDADGHALIAPVLKSNAYGHGLLEVAQILEQEARMHGGIPFCIVDSYFEAIALRAKGFKLPLLVIGYTRPETIRSSNLRDVAFTVTNLETLRVLAEQKNIVHIHLKIDTGMHRQGIMPEEIEEAIRLINDDDANKRPMVLEGICSHLSDADNNDESFSESQTHIWNKVVARFKEEFKTLKYIHLSATDGHRLTHDIAANVSRLGIGLYGLSQNEALTHRLSLMPVLEMKTIITGIKKLKEGETAGYGNTFKAHTDMTIATIPVGYYEGIDRRLSSGPAGGGQGGHVLVGHKRIPCPIIGRVSMNITTIDISKAMDAHHGAGHLAGHEIKVGDEVVAISAHGDDANSIISMAKACGTISYEIAVHIPGQLKRAVV